MKLTVIRTHFYTRATVGKLLIDGEDVGVYTLEDAIRDVKINGETAIPYGTYKVIVNFSQKFQRELPLLLNVPGFDGIRIHPGNTDHDTEGCILVGLEFKGGDFIGDSRKAFSLVFERIKESRETELEIICNS